MHFIHEMETRRLVAFEQYKHRLLIVVVIWANAQQICCAFMIKDKAIVFYMLPPFNERGFLPPGIYETTWTEFKQRFGFNTHRQNLLVGLRSVLQLLGRANVERVYLGGSFVSNKEYPNDFDGCYDDLNIDYDLLDPIFDEDPTAQQNRFGGELLADPIFQGCLLRPYLGGNLRGGGALFTD